MVNRLLWKFFYKNDLFYLRLWLEFVFDLKYFELGWFVIFWLDYDGENKMKKKFVGFYKNLKLEKLLF